MAWEGRGAEEEEGRVAELREKRTRGGSGLSERRRRRGGEIGSTHHNCVVIPTGGDGAFGLTYSVLVYLIWSSNSSVLRNAG